MSGNCATRPTATLYTSQIVTNIGTNQTQDATLLTQLIPTATLFETDCNTAVEETTSARPGVRTSSAINSQDITTRTAVVPTRTATLVSASTVNQGGQVVLVTSFSTMSASSVIIVLKTQTPSTIALSTSAPVSTSSSSSSHAGPIAGGIVAAVVLLALFAFLAYLFRKRSRRSRDTRALDDFFKDALNPGDVAVAGVAGAKSNRRRSTLLRRKSSTLLDLENEKDVSHSNDEDNWAALTRLNDQERVDEGEAETYRQRSLSRQSMHGGGGAAVSRAVSLHSIGPEGAWSNAVGVDGIKEGPVLRDVESGAAAYLNNNSSKSNTSLSRLGYDDNRAVGVKRHSSYLSSRSTDMLPTLSPGFGPPPASPGSPDSIKLAFMANRSDDALSQRLPASPPATMNRQKYARMAHHLSMSGIYPVQQHQQQQQQQPSHPGFSPPQRTMSPPTGLGMPERPKSALGVMNIPEEQQQGGQDEIQQMQEIHQRYMPHQRQRFHQQCAPQQQQPRQPGSPQWMHARQTSSDAARLQSRASFAGYGNVSPYHPHQSPPLSPQRFGSPPLHPQATGGPRRPRLHQPGFSGAYPPSRYSHLDVVDGESEKRPSSIAPVDVHNSTASRQRSLSGGMLVQVAATAAAEDRNKLRPMQSDSTASSTSTSKKNSLSIRNASPEETSAEEDEDEEGEKEEQAKLVAKGQKMGKVGGDARTAASPVLLPPSQDSLASMPEKISTEKTAATLTTATTTPPAAAPEPVLPTANSVETTKRGPFWSPQSWLGMVST